MLFSPNSFLQKYSLPFFYFSWFLESQELRSHPHHYLLHTHPETFTALIIPSKKCCAVIYFLKVLSKLQIGLYFLINNSQIWLRFFLEDLGILKKATYKLFLIFASRSQALLKGWLQGRPQSRKSVVSST